MDLVFTPISRPGFVGSVWEVTRDDGVVTDVLAEVAERLIAEPKYLVRFFDGVEEECDTRDQVAEILMARSGS